MSLIKRIDILKKENRNGQSITKRDDDRHLDLDTANVFFFFV